MRHYEVRPTAAVVRDFDFIEDHLVRVHQELGDDLESAMECAAIRIDAALAYTRTFETHPYRGTEHPRIRPGIRTVSDKSFIFYFEIDEPMSEVRILAAFFGGADHRRQILDRLQP